MADQKKVVFEYIEALLADSDNGADTPVKRDSDERAVARPGPIEQQEQEAQVDDRELSAVEPEPMPVAEPMSVPEAVVPPVAQIKKPKQIMNCVLIDMHGLKLAVNFDRIEGALQLDDLSLDISGLPEWVLGAFGADYDKTLVVDTALWLIPERYTPEHSQYGEVVILQGRKWALACDGLIKSIQIPMDRINLNNDKAHRSWLLGTYMDERCAILDIDQLVEEFEAMLA